MGVKNKGNLRRWNGRAQSERVFASRRSLADGGEDGVLHGDLDSAGAVQRGIQYTSSGKTWRNGSKGGTGANWREKECIGDLGARPAAWTELRVGHSHLTACMEIPARRLEQKAGLKLSAPGVG